MCCAKEELSASRGVDDCLALGKIDLTNSLAYVVEDQLRGSTIADTKTDHHPCFLVVVSHPSAVLDVQPYIGVYYSQVIRS